MKDIPAIGKEQAKTLCLSKPFVVHLTKYVITM